MKKLNLTLLCCLLVAMTAWAQSSYDAMAPFGFATCTSRTNAGSTSNITGGGAYTPEAAAELKTAGTKNVVTLTALGNGQDDRAQISSAINDNDIIIFDGSNGHFTMSQVLKLKGKIGKTFLGINGAEIHSKFKTTAEIRAFLDADNVKSGSSTSGGGTIQHLDGTTGDKISEQIEYNVRQSMVNHGYEDRTSKTDCYRLAGIFEFSGSGSEGAYTECCQNIIIRNIKFVGPGPIDCSGTDLISILQGAHHIWVDHCEFVDGQDGNFDITKNADFVTVSWCKFSYTENAYQHMNTNLIGSADNYKGDSGKLNVTFYANNWGDKCDQRMPMARTGKIHMLNNYYTCSGASKTIDARSNSEVLIEGNYFGAGVTTVFSQSSSTAYVWDSSNYSVENKSGSTKGSVAVPYTVDSKIPTANVPTEVGKWSGATLFQSAAAPTISISTDKSSVRQGGTITISATTTGYPESTITWYSCTDESKNGAHSVGTGASYKPTTTSVGTYYMYAVATNSEGSATSNVVSYTVTENSDVVWTFTDATTGDFANTSSGAALSVTGSDGSVLCYYSTSGTLSSIVADTKTISGETYTNYLKMGGNGSTSSRYFLTPELSGKGTLTIVYASIVAETCSIYKDGASTALTTITPEASKAVTTSEIDLTGASSALKIVHSGKCYIYAIIWTLTGTTPPATKQPVTLAFKNDFKAKVGTDINVSDIVAVTSNGTDVSDNVTPTLVSSKETIASIANGKMTVKAKGTFTLTASFEGNSSYESAEQITRTVIAYSDEDGEEVESISGSGTIWGAEQTERMSSSQATTSTGSDINGMDSYYIPSSYNPSGSGNVVYSNDDFSNAKSIKLRTGQAVSNSAKGFSFIVKEGYMINEIKVIGYSNYYNSYPVFKQVLVDDKSENKLSGEVAFPAKVSSGTQSLSNFTVSNLNATKKVDFVIETITTESSDNGTQGQFWFVVKYQKQESASSIQCVKLIMNKYGRASFSSSYDIDFSDIEGLVAYTGDHINDANGNLVLEPFTGILKAGEGVLLRGTENETYYLPISSSVGMVPSQNLLHGLKPGDLIYASTDLLRNYKFGAQSGKVGFYSVATDYMTGSYGAYLSINGGLSNAAPAAYLLEFDEDGATGIAIMENPQGQKTNVRYNISGQRVDSNYRGITIVNGRKVVRK